MTPSPELRTKRKELVLAAEQVIRKEFSGGESPDLKKAQLNHLIGICGEASCPEEIENYIRYQAGREKKVTGWSIELARRVIESIAPLIKDLTDANKVGAWQLYAVYLTRAFTYESLVLEETSSQSRRESTRRSK